jgi:hypothetical protein
LQRPGIAVAAGNMVQTEDLVRRPGGGDPAREEAKANNSELRRFFTASEMTETK